MIELKNGDCIELLKHLENKSVDMILCDLPYNLDLTALWEEYERVIKDSGCICLFAEDTFYLDLVMSNQKLFRYNLIWDKVLVNGFLNAKRMPLRQHENIAVFYKKQPTYNPQMVNIRGKLRYPTSILRYSKPHPSVQINIAEKPVELLETLILTYSNKGDIILDTCMGSGSTGVAAINTDRNFIGFEIDTKLFNISKERISNAKIRHNKKLIWYK